MTQYEDLITHFDAVDKRFFDKAAEAAQNEDYRWLSYQATPISTALGQFAPARLDSLYEFMQQAVVAGYIEPGATFLDAGAGDGRVVCLARQVFGLDASGLEIDPEIVKIAQQAAQERGIDSKRIVRGDFLSESAYERVGRPFSDFSIVYNYQNNGDRLAKKIERESRVGTIFLHYDSGIEHRLLRDWIFEKCTNLEEAALWHHTLDEKPNYPQIQYGMNGKRIARMTVFRKR
jgi:hypothetical protein